MLPIELIPDGYMAARLPERAVVAHNSRACELLGCAPETLASSRLDTLFEGGTAFPDDTDGNERRFNHRIRLQNGTTRQLTVTVIPRAEAGEERLHLFLRETGPVSNEREKLAESLRRKGLLLQEMNHRIKNNLATVSALIRLKSSQLGDDTLLANLVGQVESIRRVHEQLSEQPDELRIRILPYFEEIVAAACSAYRCDDVTVDYRVPDIKLPSKAAATLGLILNEIASNTGKYGFPEGWHGEKRLEISLERPSESGRWCLDCSHSGPPIGIAGSMDPDAGLGMKLIESLTAELRGEFRLERAGSPRYRVEFPSPPDTQATGS